MVDRVALRYGRDHHAHKRRCCLATAAAGATMRQEDKRCASVSSARAGTPREAATFGDVVMLSVPWGVIDQALAEAGSLDGKIVIDTTNQFGTGGVAELPGG